MTQPFLGLPLAYDGTAHRSFPRLQSQLEASLAHALGLRPCGRNNKPVRLNTLVRCDVSGGAHARQQFVFLRAPAGLHHALDELLRVEAAGLVVVQDVEEAVRLPGEIFSKRIREDCRIRVYDLHRP